MGISVEIWRARIGSFNCGGSNNSVLIFLLPTSKLVAGIYVSIAIILMLLVIGNIESNPGPVYPCFICNSEAKSVEDHIRHQQMHSDTHNFMFRCPVPLCQHSYDTFRSLQAHVSQHKLPKPDDVPSCDANILKCFYCDQTLSSNRFYCKHLQEHVLEGLDISCPFSSCTRSSSFTKSSVFSTHLSQCHPGWLKDYSRSLGVIADIRDAADEVFEDAMDIPLSFGHASDNDGDTNTDLHYNADSDSSSTCSLEDDEECLVDHHNVVRNIAHFYVMLEGKKIVPSTTVDSIAKKLGLLSEILQDKLKRDLKNSLNQAGLSEEVAKNVIDAVVSMDPLYNAHHLNAPGDTLLSFDRRKTYYKKHFKLQDFETINLKKNPHDKEDQLQYVNIEDSLKIMLQDPSTQKEVYRSFNAPESDGRLIKDYKDGSVYRHSSTPKKTIDLLLFMDGLTCTNSLGSAKLEHKMDAMYLTLGNLTPYKRSYLQAMRLVLLVNDKSLKLSDRIFKKAFERVMKDIKRLEENGIEFNGERVSVRLQFVQGDNLGQMTLSGFVESFTNTFFCRFCDKHYDEFKNDVAVAKPKPKFGNWRTPESYAEDLRVQQAQNLHNSHGVKRNSPLHKLEHFHVCDPRLAPCIGHDLFISDVVDLDVRSMIEVFVEKGWFTIHELNMRIKRFKYIGNDARNKPAQLPAESVKLGGHAIQNWTLVRLLPILIHDKIVPDDKTWRLFLLLRSIIELVCAPALTTDQVEVMRRLIKKYWKKRSILPNNNYLPKHHLFSHYPDLFLLFGPLIHLWSMSFEHRHQYFKRVSKICNNFVNLGNTLAQKYQLLQAYQNMGEMFPERPVFRNTSPLRDIELKSNLQEFVNSCTFGLDAVIVDNLTLHQINYKKNDWLLLGSSIVEGQEILSVGKIQLIIHDNGICSSIIKKYKTQEWEQLGLHCIPKHTQPELCLVNLSHLDVPVPHPMYKLKGVRCLSLKHVFAAQTNDTTVQE